MRQCFPSPSSPSDGVYQAWGWGRGSDLQRIRICSLFSYWLGGIPLGEKKLSEEEKSIWSLEKLHGSPLSFPFLPTAPAAAAQMPAQLTLTDKPHFLPHNPFPWGCIVPFVPLHGPHTPPQGCTRTHITGVCNLCWRRSECLCLPPASLSYLRAFCFFRDYMRN